MSGCCIGAGMLAFPIASGLAGFFPSMVSFGAAWAFMTLASFLLLEVNLRFGCEVSLVTMAEKTLGKFAQVVTWVTFLFLFYALSIAYITGTTSLVAGVFKFHFQWDVASWKISVFSALFVGVIIFLGKWLTVTINRFLMLGLVIAYLGLVFFLAPHVQTSYLMHHNFSNAVLSLPIMMVAFGFQNLIPSLTDLYGADSKKLKKVIWGGGLLALIIYLFWQLVVQGVVPLRGPNGILDSLHNGREAAQSLIHITKSDIVGNFAWGFAFFAIGTSFLAQSLSIFDFLADGLQIEKKGFLSRVILVALSIAPPLVIALWKPGLFLSALSFAGGICAMILFGILPALMCWVGRKEKIPLQFKVAGKNTLLGFVIAASCSVIIIELLRELGVWKMSL